MIEIQEKDGTVMALGTSPRPRDRDEDKFSAVRSMPPAIVNLNEPVSLLKYCPPILNQMSVGACAQFTVAECDFITRNYARAQSGQSSNAELAHAGYLYEQTRRMRGWFPRDSGSWPADGFDMLLKDKPLASRSAYIDNAAFDYEDSMFQNVKPIDDLASHRPFYVTDGDALQRIKQCLDLGWAISICMYWHPDYFAPNGVLPEGRNWTPEMGGHAMTIRGRTPDHGGLSAVINHWTAGWNRAVTNLGFDFRPGEVAIPDSFFLPDRNSPVFELRAASPELVEIEPEPEPEPIPDPNKPPTIKNVISKPKAGRYVVKVKNADSECRLWIDGDVTEAAVEGGKFALLKFLDLGTHSATVVNGNGKASAPFQFQVIKK